jgi:hypothetical protein
MKPVLAKVVRLVTEFTGALAGKTNVEEFAVVFDQEVYTKSEIDARLGDSAFRVVKKLMTQAQLYSQDPVEIIAAPGADKIVILRGVMARTPSGALAYSAVPHFHYAGELDNPIATSSHLFTGFDQYSVNVPGWGADLRNKAIVARMPEVPVSGTGDIELYVEYSVIDWADFA